MIIFPQNILHCEIHEEYTKQVISNVLAKYLIQLSAVTSHITTPPPSLPV